MNYRSKHLEVMMDKIDDAKKREAPNDLSVIAYELITELASVDDQAINIQKMLKFRIPAWRNKDYWKWCSSQRIIGFEWHHLLSRSRSDLFVVNIPKEVHDRIHHGSGYEDGEFETLFIESLTNIMRFIDDNS